MPQEYKLLVKDKTYRFAIRPIARLSMFAVLSLAVFAVFRLFHWGPVSYLILVLSSAAAAVIRNKECQSQTYLTITSASMKGVRIFLGCAAALCALVCVQGIGFNTGLSTMQLTSKTTTIGPRQFALSDADTADTQRVSLAECALFGGLSLGLAMLARGGQQAARPSIFRLVIMLLQDDARLIPTSAKASLDC